MINKTKTLHNLLIHRPIILTYQTHIQLYHCLIFVGLHYEQFGHQMYKVSHSYTKHSVKSSIILLRMRGESADIKEQGTSLTLCLDHEGV